MKKREIMFRGKRMDNGEWVKDVIELETFEAVENVVGWHTEVIPTADPLSKLEPFNLTMPLNKFYLERSEMIVIGNIYDNPELLKDGEQNE